MKLPSRAKRYWILYYLVLGSIVIGGTIVFINNNQYHKEIQACFGIYNDPTVEFKIRDHCRQVIEEYKAKSDAEEAEKKRKYLKNFDK